VSQFVGSSVSFVLEYFWPALLGIAAITVTSAISSKFLKRVFLAAVTLTFSGCLVLALGRTADPTSNQLTRDSVAWVTIGVLATLAAYALSLRLKSAAVWLRVCAQLGVVVVLVVCAPIAMLLVHCSFGDCL
jgi:hypothetical protein